MHSQIERSRFFDMICKALDEWGVIAREAVLAQPQHTSSIIICVCVYPNCGLDTD